MTREEKVGQLVNEAPAIPRLGIPAYDWWSESLHGVARNGVATVFPQAIGLAATFDEDLLRRIGEAIAAEARAKLTAAGGPGRGTGRYEGLTFFAPNLNIFRDPRWGRGQETYGEDPYLTARLGVAYVQGLQGGADPQRRSRVGVAAVAKHFAVHSGPEANRFEFDARASTRDLFDTYLPQFEAVVREGQVAGIMAAYNRLNGQPCVANPWLLDGLLRRHWGFQGFIVGDCGAVGNLVSPQGAAPDAAAAAAMALKAGTDLDCGSTFRSLGQALRRGLVSEAEVDRALVRLFAVRFRLGLLGPPRGSDSQRDAETSSARAVVASPQHRALAREAAQKSIVLLENDGTLPLGPGVRRLAVVGPGADDRQVLLGNYHGEPVSAVTFLDGIRAAAKARGIAVRSSRGANFSGRSRAELAEAVAVARWADVVVAAVGLTPRLEGEEGEPGSLNPSGDRSDIGLPGRQPELLRALAETGRPVVVVLTGGGAIALPAMTHPPRAVLATFYPGEAGGSALADVLFGDVSPSGRLPITFYRSTSDLPPFADYRMQGRTYRYFRGQPGHAFGRGLGYAQIRYDGAEAELGPGGDASVRVKIINPSRMRADEVMTVFVTSRARRAEDPLRALAAFRRISLAPGEQRTVELPVAASAFTRVENDGRRTMVPGAWEIEAGRAPRIMLEIPAPRVDAAGDAGRDQIGG